LVGKRSTIRGSAGTHLGGKSKVVGVERDDGAHRYRAAQRCRENGERKIAAAPEKVASPRRTLELRLENLLRNSSSKSADGQRISAALQPLAVKKRKKG
jgi:hypothetical protein